MLPEEDYVDYSDSELDLDDDVSEVPPAVTSAPESPAEVSKAPESHSRTTAPVIENPASREPVPPSYRPISFKAARKEPNIAQRKSYGADLYKLQHQLRAAGEKAKEVKREAARKQKEAAEKEEREREKAEAVARHKKMMGGYGRMRELGAGKQSSDGAGVGAEIGAELADSESKGGMTGQD